MADRQYYELPEFSAILTFIDSIFIELNMGLLIYHLEQMDDPSTLKLIYANREASRCTGADLRPLVGKRILEAFPRLGDTGLPELYAGVVNDARPRQVDQVEYADANLERGSYRVKAFPMPSQCVGVLFERVV